MGPYVMCGTNFNYLKVRLLENERADPPKVAIGKDCYQSEKKGKKKKVSWVRFTFGTSRCFVFWFITTIVTQVEARLIVKM